jgi:hypothetical protein
MKLGFQGWAMVGWDSGESVGYDIVFMVNLQRVEELRHWVVTLFPKFMSYSCV